MRRPIIRDVSVQWQFGQVHALIGCNGAGKTTLLRTLAGLLPHKGQVSIGGSAAFVFEGQRFPAVMTSDVIRAYRVRDEDLAWLSLAELRDRRADRLSLGQRQRLALAIGLAKRPAVLFLDEPTTGLDPRGVDHLLALLAEMRIRGITVVLSSHHLKEVGPLCTSVTVLREGRVSFSAPIIPGHSVDEAFRRFA